MDITYLGHSSFRIKTKTATVITDPFDTQMVGIKYPPQEADIVTVSHDHGDHNAVDKVTGTRKVIDGPGEYEVMGVSIIGYKTFHDSKNGEERGKNTVYVFETEKLRVCHLGDLGHPLSEELINDIGDIDVLMVPVGGDYTIDSKLASEAVNKIEPFFVIPMHYQQEGLKAESFSSLEGVETFLKETGLTVENVDKFTLKKDDIMDGQSTKVIVLTRK